MKKFISCILFTFIGLIVCGYCAAQNSFLDSSFGNNGVVIAPGDAFSHHEFEAVIIQPDHKIIAAGFAAGGAIMKRFNENGSLDNSFATGGIFATPNNGRIYALLLQPDNKIIAVGYPNMRFNSDGTLDDTFGIGGLDTVLNFPPNTFGADAISLQPDGKIVLAGGVNGTAIGVVRLLPNGTIDSTFGINGLVATNTWVTWAWGLAESVAVLPDGRIIVSGATSLNGFFAIRLLMDGSADTTFNHTGIAITYAGGNFNYCHGMYVQANGKIVLGGSGGFGVGNGDFALIRYNTDGTLDRSYGDTGVVHVDFNGKSDEIWALCGNIDGSVIVAGQAIVSTTECFALSRIDSNGKIDSSFGNNGRILTQIQDSNSRIYAVGMQYDGKIVTAGFSKGNITNRDELTLARYINFHPSEILSPEAAADIVFFPNPTNNTIYIRCSCNSHITCVSFYDMAGRIIKTVIEQPYAEVSTTGWPNGTYMIRIDFSDRQSATTKILIQK